jgi:hypothetical protein
MELVSSSRRCRYNNCHLKYWFKNINLSFRIWYLFPSYIRNVIPNWIQKACDSVAFPFTRVPFIAYSYTVSLYPELPSGSAVALWRNNVAKSLIKYWCSYFQTKCNRALIVLRAPWRYYVNFINWILLSTSLFLWLILFFLFYSKPY